MCEAPVASATIILNIILTLHRNMLLLCSLLVTGVASFIISAPEENLVAVRGHPVILACQFTPDPDLYSLVVNWQRQEDSQVVHSFYLQRDQLDRQSQHYHNRTSLFISELAQGNASLRMDEVGLQDAGQYLCQVSNAKGSGTALIELGYGVFYSEPRLSVYIDPTTLTAQVETEGFPKPEVSWLGEQGQNLSHHLELFEQTEDGLCFIKSRYKSHIPAINVTFTLKNILLNQSLERPLIINNVSGDAGNGRIAVIVLSVVSITLLAVLIFLLLKQRIIPAYLLTPAE